MSTNRRTIIRFDYGGHYTSNIDGSSLWNPKEANKTYVILFNASKKNVTYSELVHKICKKMGVDVTSKLLFSYISTALHHHTASYVMDDKDVYVYLIEGEKTSGLHVEIVAEESEQIHIEEVVTREELRHEINRFPSLDGFPTLVSLIGDGVDESFNTNNTESLPHENHTILKNGENMVCDQVVAREELGTGVYVMPTLAFVPTLVSQVEGGLDELANSNNTESNFEEGGNEELSWEDGLQFALGQEFESKEIVVDFVEKDCHQNCFDIATVKSTKVLYVVRCRQNDKGCKWYLRVAKLKNADCFSVRSYNKVHTCSRVTSITRRRRRKGTPGMVASILHEDYPGQLDTPTPKNLIGLVQVKLGVKVSYSTALRGKKKAANVVRGSPEESYKLLHSYLYMLEQVNLDSKTIVELHDDKRFKYLFIALGACIEGFKVMRKVIVVDACFLKTVRKGVLMIASAQDPNLHHYPIAFGVVDGEKDESWTWFMNTLKTVIPDNHELVFVSDRHNSIHKSIAQVYLLSQHGFCIWHLSQNVKSNANTWVNREVVAARFRECAQPYSEIEFNKLYDAFRLRYPAAGEYLDNSVSEGKWAKCYFPGQRYNIDTTNTAESLNSVFWKRESYRYYHCLMR